MQKEHPILFSTAMVEALLDGRKTLTRRVVKSEKVDIFTEDIKFGYTTFTPEQHISVRGKWYDNGEARYGESFVKCPYGQPGDTLYVRETWQHTRWALNMSLTDENSGYIYKASENGRDWEQNDENWKWKPGIHLPKEGSRIWLEITDVRVERLQDISKEDAKAEGLYREWDGSHYWFRDYGGLSGLLKDAVRSFKSLWDKINGEKHPWDSNPWLWCVSFNVLSSTGKPNLEPADERSVATK